MTRLLALLTLCLTGAVAVAAPVSDTLYDDYAAAVDAAARADWLDALGRLSALDRALDTCDIDDSDFELIYWPAKKSLAEVAARLGLHGLAGRVADRMARDLDCRPDSSAAGRGRLADLCKIEGSTAVLLRQHHRADSLLLRAIDLKPYDLDFSYHVLSELASTAYDRRDYATALRRLDSIAAQTRRLPPAEADALHREVAGKRAMVLARLGHFGSAVGLADSLLSVAAPDERPERIRSLAKILMLEADSTHRYPKRAEKLYREYMRLTRREADSHIAALDAGAREQYWMAELPYLTDCYRLEDHAPDLLYDIALYTKGILLRAGRIDSIGDADAKRRALADRHLFHGDVRSALPARSAAIEYVSYDRGGRSRLAAIVQRKDRRRPVFVALPTADSIAAHRLAGTTATVAEALAVSRDRNLINALYTDSALAAMIWPAELTAALDGATDVYFAPDGLLHRLAAEYLAPPGMRLHRLTSTRLLCAPRRPARPGAPMLIAGGVDYTGTVAESCVAAANDPLAYSLMSACVTSLAPLPGSQAEVDSVAALRSRVSDVVMHADSVTESAVRTRVASCRMMLLSTHGVFADAADTATDLRPAAADTQLSQSCLFLAGAERNLRDESFDPTRPDGILSARELAATDLSSIDLAVLSACMSGLGYVTPDGVFGLQRGLKAAGAGAIVTSLWEVDDRATSLLMRHLFAGIDRGLSVRDAFDQARITLRDTVIEKHYPGFTRHIRFDSPYFYNAFTLIDAL